MEQSLIRTLQAAIWGHHIGEPVRVDPPDGGPSVTTRAIWQPAGSEIAGASDAQAVIEADEYAFRRSDTDAINAAVRNATIHRLDSDGTPVAEYLVVGIGTLAGEQRRVIVQEQ